MEKAEVRVLLHPQGRGNNSKNRVLILGLANRTVDISSMSPHDMLDLRKYNVPDHAIKMWCRNTTPQALVMAAERAASWATSGSGFIETTSVLARVDIAILKSAGPSTPATFLVNEVDLFGSAALYGCSSGCQSDKRQVSM